MRLRWRQRYPELLYTEAWPARKFRRRSSWGRSTVHTACPLDCPDCCSLAVTVERGRIVKIDGSDHAPSTDSYICGKVRRFDRRVYSDERLLLPAVRSGPKGAGAVRARDLGRGARSRRDEDARGARHARRRGRAALLLRRLERPADQRVRGRAVVPPLRRVAARAHRLRGADGRRRHGDVRQDGRRRVPRLRATRG